MNAPPLEERLFEIKRLHASKILKVELLLKKTKTLSFSYFIK